MTRTRTLLTVRTVAALVGGALLVAGPLTSGVQAKVVLDREDYVEVFDRDVYFVDHSTLRNPRADTDPGERLFNDVRVLCAAHLSIEGDQRGRVQLAQQPLHDCLPIHVVPLG